MGREKWFKGPLGITWGKMKQESLVVSLFYHFLGVSAPENKYMKIEALVVLLPPDAPCDNQFVDTSLSPEHIQPCDSPRFSLLWKADMSHCC